MQILKFPQATPEWWMARRGKATASNFHRILTPTGKLSAQADDYAAELIGDLYRLEPPAQQELSSYANAAMRHGAETEAEARSFIEMELRADVEQVGLCVTDCGRFACSPDGILPARRMGVEIKCPSHKVQVKYLLAGTLPDEYRLQVAGSLLVTGYDSWLFCSYAPGLPPLLLRVIPDEYTEALRAALEAFHVRYTEALARIRALDRTVEAA